MKTILQVDKNYKQNSNYSQILMNLENMSKNKNNYNLCVDDDEFIKNRGDSYTKLKIIKLLDILKKYDDNDIIMYIDAFDTYVDATDHEIENKFLESDADVIYSCEKNCWPNTDFSKYFSDQHFVNSGTIIFKNVKFQKILEVISLLHQKTNECDQYYHTVFAAINLMNVKIKLDESNEFFQCLWGENENNFEKIDGRIKNKNTNTFPCVFHGNGDGDAILKKLFENKKEVSFLGFLEDNMGINFTNSSHVFEKIKVFAEIKNTLNQVIYFNTLELPYNISFFIHTGIKDNYTFTIYDTNNEILLQEKNF